MNNVDRLILRTIGVTFFVLMILMCVSMIINFSVSPMPSDNEIKAFCVFEDSNKIEAGLLDKDEV